MGKSTFMKWTAVQTKLAILLSMTPKNITSWIYSFDISKTEGQINYIVFTKTLNKPVECTFKTLASMCVITALGLYCNQGRSVSVGLWFKFKPAPLRLWLWLRPFSAEQTLTGHRVYWLWTSTSRGENTSALPYSNWQQKKTNNFHCGEVPKRFVGYINHYAQV